MTYQESTQRLQRLASDVGSQDAPVFFSDLRSVSHLPSRLGRSPTIWKQLPRIRRRTGDVPFWEWRGLSGAGRRAGETEDGRKCVIFEYDSVSAQ